MDAWHVRRLPGWRIVKELKSRGVTQWEVARRAPVGQSVVSKVIHRRYPKESNASIRVWRVLEEVLG